MKKLSNNHRYFLKSYLNLFYILPFRYKKEYSPMPKKQNFLENYENKLEELFSNKISKKKQNEPK